MRKTGTTARCNQAAAERVRKGGGPSDQSGGQAKNVGPCTNQLVSFRIKLTFPV